jgi:hypothetical protein
MSNKRFVAIKLGEFIRVFDTLLNRVDEYRYPITSFWDTTIEDFAESYNIERPSYIDDTSVFRWAPATCKEMMAYYRQYKS